MTVGDKLFSRKGYEIRLDFSKGIYSTNMDIPGEPRKFGPRIDYIGALSPVFETEECPGDRYYLSRFTSPFRHNDCEYVMYGPYFDHEDNIWANYSNHFMVKDPGIAGSGLKLVYNVPEKLSRIGAVMTVYADGIAVFEKELTQAGTNEDVIDLTEAAGEEEAYLEEARAQHKELLNEWIGFCDKHGIEYRLICGGALGAYREGDFIPWDDDIDVCVRRSDFEKIRKLAPEWSGSSDFELIGPRDISDSVFFDFMTRLVYKGKTLPSSLFDRIRGMTDCGAEDHAVLDIYILENGFDLIALHGLQTGLLTALYGLAMGHRPYFDEGEYAGGQAWKVPIVKMLMSGGKHVALGRITAAYERVSRMKKRPGKYCFFSNGYAGCLSMRFESKWFEKGRKARLGDMEVVLPGMIEAYLRRQYGEFKQLPPSWARRPSHFKPKERGEENDG